MTDSPTTHYLNSDFDLTLRPRPRQLALPRLVRQVRELSVQALLGAQAGDSVLVQVELPPEFLAHLGGCGLPVPALLRHPAIDPVKRFRPFGWSAEAIELNRMHRRPAKHPTLEVVRRVNSRSLALELEAQLEPRGAPGSVVESAAELESFLARAPAGSEWVVKAEHGHAGLANRRLRAPGLAPADRRFVEARFAEDDRLVVEPWLPREHDWSVVFDVPFDRATLRIHETVNTRDGALIGALFEPGGGAATPWDAALAGMAERVSSKLKDEGYFGPVCVDAFSWRDRARSGLRVLVDLNCRRSMSDGAHRLWQRLAPERSFYYRFFNRGKLSLPDELASALDALGPRRYEPGQRRGILLLSPLHVSAEGERWRPAKLAVAFVADGRPQILELERWFRRRFEV